MPNDPTSPDLNPSALLASDGLVLAMVIVSVLVVALALAKGAQILRFRRQLHRADSWVIEAARRGDLRAARLDCDKLLAPVAGVFAQGLDRALGTVRGDPGMAMRREERRAMGSLRRLIWLLGTTGALMPFAGLLGTVVGVMAAFHAIGESAGSGFDVVASGISAALIATAAGLFVALEAVVLYNILQNAVAAQGRDLSLLVDELLEIIRTEEASRDSRHPG